MNTRADDTREAWASGASIFAATMMMVVGTFQFFEGLVAVLDGDEFLVRTNNYVLQLDATTWGWVHLILGALLVLIGALVLNGNDAARASAIAIVGLSAIANFLWLPYYPLWAIVVIALDVFVIWGLVSVDLERG